MEQKPKITVAGVGGVGGLLAGVLVRSCGDAVTLIARGARAEHLRSEGLTLHSDVYGEFTVQPSCVAADGAGLPVQDFVLVSVKNDAIPSIAEKIRPLIGPDTTVLTVMNGVSAGSRLRGLLSCGHVAESVIYTVSMSGADYSVTQLGKFTQIFAGVQPGDTAAEAGCRRLCEVLSGAGIECHYSEDVQSAIWTKYILNCAYNVVTARHAVNIGEVKSSPKLYEEYRVLMEEAMQVGLAAGVSLPDDLIPKLMRRLDKSTDDSTSSLSRDFDIGRVGEMEVFSGEVVRMAKKYGVPAPLSEDYYEGLKERAASFSK